MQKPVFFISSTIFDFKDLRSAIKWWLEENGYSVNASEYNDFSKPLDENSYEACFKAIDESDYFILLLGDRTGGMYDETATITQMEYRRAYQRMFEGKLKVINLIRHETWQQFNDVKGRIKRLRSQLKIEDTVFDLFTSTEEKVRWAFIDEVRRVDEMKQGIRPKGNWLHQFGTFEDIISVFRSELGGRLDLRFKQSRFIIINDIVKNLRAITSKHDGRIYEIGFMNSELWKDFKIDTSTRYLLLTNSQYVNFASFYVSCLQIKPMKISRIESFYRSGFFLDYDRLQHDFVDGNMNQMATRLLSSYEKLDSLHKALYKDSDRLLSLGKQDDNSHLHAETMEIFFALEYHDEIRTCMDLSVNLYKALTGRKYNVLEPRSQYERMPKEMRPKKENIVNDIDIYSYLNDSE